MIGNRERRVASELSKNNVAASLSHNVPPEPLKRTQQHRAPSAAGFRALDGNLDLVSFHGEWQPQRFPCS